ncbi:hypothetical protein [Grimontia sp. NTOU-MAR1]|uniref:hypothetical protein n=1 Tax=Grimontia sp. NTOU-MAR1 TaxID=3111011 RepID=UPI002DB6F696|nr:hypothetical protein [Grimontia sp. NTOU-MAR1]WRV97968.1 hypothetical protein VP504_00575 [Grimontia sp. NTOU-MAR1]
MKLKLKKVTILRHLLILLPLTSAASYSQEWSGGTNLKTIYPHSHNNGVGTVYYSFEKMINPSNCTHGWLIALRKDNKLSSEIYSLLLTAFTTDTKVNYYVGGCDDAGFPVMHHIQLSK